MKHGTFKKLLAVAVAKTRHADDDRHPLRGRHYGFRRG